MDQTFSQTQLFTRGAEVAGLRLLDATAMPSDSESASESTVTNVTWLVLFKREM